MKNSIIVLAILLGSMIAQAGPIVSGGILPNTKSLTYKCSNGDTNLTVTVSGKSGWGALTDVNSGDEVSLSCRPTRSRADAVSSVVAVCRPTDGNMVVKVISSRGIVGLQAIVKDGNDSTSLVCHF